jgi:hypothetical protein
VKEVGHPKFYFFDTGVVRALAGHVREPLERAERGPLLETYVFHELRAYQDYAGCGGDFSYWGTPSRAEVDFVGTRARRAVGIEVKATPRWRAEDTRSLAGLVEAGVVKRAYGVNEGSVPLRIGRVDVPKPDWILRPRDPGRSMARMPHHRGVILLVIALIVAAPVVSAVTFESWTDGIYDAESDYGVQATNCNSAAVVCEPVLTVGPALVVLATLSIIDEAPVAPTTLPTADTRAPPPA